ncbi:class I SAM-dependent methyltransferase [soil metagenome]
MADNNTTRADGDSWDLASSVGATATAVAASRAMASKGPDALLDDPFAEPLVRAVGLDPFVRMLDGETADDNPALNKQAMNEQITVRTRFFDDFFISAAEAGVHQAVILAAGLDTRAYRLSWPTGTVVYEVDQPQVIEFKTTTLAGLHAEPAATRRTVAVDLRDDWPAALKQAGFDPAAPTAWIAEGLLIYLPPDAQDRLFDNITALSAPGSRLATEHMDMSELPDDWAQRLTERSRLSGSNIDLADLFYTGERNPAGDYLTSQGWAVTTRSSEEAFTANGFTLADDELARLASSSGYLSATFEQ